MSTAQAQQAPPVQEQPSQVPPGQAQPQAPPANQAQSMQMSPNQAQPQAPPANQALQSGQAEPAAKTSTDQMAAVDTLDPSSWPQWTCVFQEATQAGAAKLDAWTVGNRYLLSCSGPSIGQLSQEKLRLEFPKEEQQYTLHLLQVKTLNIQQAQFVVTGYKPGEYKLEGLKVTDGKDDFVVNPLEWKVTSILEGQAQPKPIPPFGPFQMSFPWWYYGLWVLAGVLVIGYFWRKGRKYHARKKLIESLAAHSTALSPFNQLNKDIRGLLRSTNLANKEQVGDFVKQIEEMFRLFLIRQLLVPALDWSDRDVLRDIRKRHHSVHKDSSKKIQGLFREFKKAQGADEKLSRVDAEQLLEMTRQVADSVDNSYREASR